MSEPHNPAAPDFWIGGCPVYGRARSPQECEKCGGDLSQCPVYGERCQQAEAEELSRG